MARTHHELMGSIPKKGLVGPVEKVNWFRVIVDLESAGYSHAATGAAVGVSKRTVGGWKQGATPKHDDGERLITLWCMATSNERENLPMVSRYDWRA